MLMSAMGRSGPKRLKSEWVGAGRSTNVWNEGKADISGHPGAPYHQAFAAVQWAYLEAEWLAPRTRAKLHFGLM